MKIIKQGKTAEEIYNELLEQGVEVTIINGVYCKVVYGTFEAINPIAPIVEYEEGELEEINDRGYH